MREVEAVIVVDLCCITFVLYYSRHADDADEDSSMHGMWNLYTRLTGRSKWHTEVHAFGL